MVKPDKKMALPLPFGKSVGRAQKYDVSNPPPPTSGLSTLAHLTPTGHRDGAIVRRGIVGTAEAELRIAVVEAQMRDAAALGDRTWEVHVGLLQQGFAPVEEGGEAFLGDPELFERVVAPADARGCPVFILGAELTLRNAEAIGYRHARVEREFVEVGINADVADLAEAAVARTVVHESDLIETDTGELHRVGEFAGQCHGVVEEFGLVDADLMGNAEGDQTMYLSLEHFVNVRRRNQRKLQSGDHNLCTHCDSF